MPQSGTKRSAVMYFKNTNPTYFLTVAREGNITRAAEKLFITQPSLSQHIAKLEKTLGVKLFDRSKNPMRLTPSGEIYYHYLENTYYLSEKLQADLDNEQLQHITIGVGTWRGSLLLPDILPEFMKEYPGIRIDLAEFPVSELIPMIQDSKVDFALMNSLLSQIPPNITTETIKGERVLLIMHKSHPLSAQFARDRAEGRPLNLHLLEEECLIALDKKLTVGRFIDNYLTKKKLFFTKRITTTNNATLLRMVAHGMGVGFMIEAGLRDEQAGNLAIFDLKEPDLIIPLTLLTKENAYLSPAVRSCIETIKRYYNKKEEAIL